MSFLAAIIAAANMGAPEVLPPMAETGTVKIALIDREGGITKPVWQSPAFSHDFTIRYLCRDKSIRSRTMVIHTRGYGLNFVDLGHERTLLYGDELNAPLEIYDA